MRDLVIVTGHEADRVVAASSGPRRRHVFNPRHDQGIGTSVAAGIGALDADCAGVLIAQGDMPGLDARLVTALLQRFQDAACDVIVHPRLPDGRQGNPVVWPRRLFAALARLDGDRGAKPLIAAEAWRTATIAASEAAAGVDIDTEAALAAYLGRSAGGGEDQ